jgi:hypothetical protein
MVASDVMASNLLVKFHSPTTCGEFVEGAEPTPSAAITTDADKTLKSIAPAKIALIDFIIRFSSKKWLFIGFPYQSENISGSGVCPVILRAAPAVLLRRASQNETRGASPFAKGYGGTGRYATKKS